MKRLLSRRTHQGTIVNYLTDEDAGAREYEILHVCRINEKRHLLYIATTGRNRRVLIKSLAGEFEVTISKFETEDGQLVMGISMATGLLFLLLGST